MGAAPGTVPPFMMSVIGLSFPEMVILRKVPRIPLIAAFTGVVVIVGYLFNVFVVTFLPPVAS